MKITRSDLRKLIRDAYCDSSKPQTNESLAAIGRWVMSNKLMTGLGVATILPMFMGGASGDDIPDEEREIVDNMHQTLSVTSELVSSWDDTPEGAVEIMTQLKASLV